MDVIGEARNLLARAGAEAHLGATLLRARGAGVARIPPHRYVAVVRALGAYGPAGAAIALAAAGQGDSVAIFDERGPETFSELDQRSNALANALRAQGLRSDATIGILARNHRGLFETIFAAAKVGARTLLLNTDFAGPQFADVCAREGTMVLVHDEEFTSIVSGYEPPLGRILAWSDGPNGGRTVDSLIAAHSAAAPPRPGGKQRIVLLTSGTTGTPKGAPRDLGVSMIIPGGYLSKIPLRSGRTVLLAGPAFHAWGLLSSMLALGLGNTIVITRRFDPVLTVAQLERHGCDALITVPILLSRLLASATREIGSRDLSSLRIIAVSGSALSAELATRTMDLFGDVLYNLYGSTEATLVTIATPADLRAAPGTVGRPPFGTTITLLDPDDREVAPGATGRIFVGNSIHFEGYTGGGDKERIAGLMATGDVGHFDAGGRLFLDGRDDDMIISGGENVYPGEIEELLATHDSILEAAVVGIADPDFGTRLRAHVVRADGRDIDAEGVREFVKATLARFKVPRDVLFLDELPRNPAGKVVKSLLPDG